MKKILVTGGAGFVGSNLIKLLLEKGHKVTSLDNYDSGTTDNHHKGADYITGDIDLINTMDKDVDIIYHMAALSRIQPSFNNPGETYRVNALGTQKVCEFARLANAKVVYAGSSSRWHDPYQSPYAACKHIGEEACKMYKKTYGMDIEIARFYNVYGPGEIVYGDWAAVIGIWRRQAEAKDPITIVGDGEQKRDFTHVEDIVEGLFRIGFKQEVHEDAWELGTGTNYSINEVYLMFKEKFGTDYKYIPEQSGNYRETLRENNDALERLGWKPEDKLLSYINSL
jgi:UDP-glucose 4-epimerase